MVDVAKGLCVRRRLNKVSREPLRGCIALMWLTLADLVLTWVELLFDLVLTWADLVLTWC